MNVFEARPDQSIATQALSALARVFFFSLSIALLVTNAASANTDAPTIRLFPTKPSQRSKTRPTSR